MVDDTIERQHCTRNEKRNEGHGARYNKAEWDETDCGRALK